MRKGFVFDHGKCTGCGACAAACVLENKLTIRPRTILNTNVSIIPSLPLTNISIACNHCEKAACLDGCPTGAISRDIHTSAVLIDGLKCLGCHYCQWNCPWDAPKYDESPGITGKCNLCNTLLRANMQPACTTACPTGALSYGQVPEKNPGSVPPWFPGLSLNPALLLTGSYDKPPLRIEPAAAFSEVNDAVPGNKNEIMPEWSLIAFTFMASVAAALTAASLMTGSTLDWFRLSLLLGSAMLASLFHLGKPLRSWRALANTGSSPLSREILAYILFSALALGASLSDTAYLRIASAASGIALVILIDLVYHFSAKGSNTLLSSGQAFLIALLTASFLAGETIAFLFLASLRILLSAMFLTRKSSNPALAPLRVFRILVLLLTGAVLLLMPGFKDSLFTVFFLAGEFCDRILFYGDFKPVKLEDKIKEYRLWPGKT